MRDLKDYPGYAVTEDGKVWSHKTNRFLRPSIVYGGYHHVHLRVNGKTKNKSVHQLVAIAYIPNPENKPQVNHIDNNPENNCVSNLEWCTQSENVKHAARQGRMSKGKTAKITEEIALELIHRASESPSDLAKEYGIPVGIIHKLYRKERWKHLFVGELEHINLQIKGREKSTRQKSQKHGMAKPRKLSDLDVENIVMNKDNLSYQQLADKFNVSKGLIASIFKGRARCTIAYKFGITPKKWPKETPFPKEVDTTEWKVDSKARN